MEEYPKNIPMQLAKKMKTNRTGITMQMTNILKYRPEFAEVYNSLYKLETEGTSEDQIFREIRDKIEFGGEKYQLHSPNIFTRFMAHLEEMGGIDAFLAKYSEPPGPITTAYLGVLIDGSGANSYQRK